MQLAKYGATAEEKRAALSGITGYADSYINTIKSYYATSEEGQKAINSIMTDIGGLDKMIPVEELQLNKLQEIKDAIDAGNLTMPTTLSEANLKVYEKIIEDAKVAGQASFLNPTVENQLRYDAFAKIVLMIDKTSKSGADSTFINALVESVGGATGLQAQVDLIIKDAKFNTNEKDRIIGNILASFNEKTLILNNFEFDVSDAIAKAKALISSSLNGSPVKTGGSASATSTMTADTTSAAWYTASMEETKRKAALQETFTSRTQMENWYATHPEDNPNFQTFTLTKFANGGIANEASIFGESGAEAAVPLPDGRSIPVKIINSSNDASINTAETIAELKSQNQKLEVLVNTMMATSKAERDKTQELIDAMNGLRTDTRLKNKA